MAPPKNRKCKVCKTIFKRPNNLTIHMETAHKQLIQKLRCPVCHELISTIANMLVHLKRESKKNKAKYKLRKGKINGEAIKYVWVSSKSLQHGRYYGEYICDDSSNNVESEDAGTVDKTVKPKRKMSTRLTKSRSNVETNELHDDSSDYEMLIIYRWLY